MTNGKVLLTQEGYEELQNELEYLITVRRAEVSEKIRVARGFGDLSENAEYNEAKDEQVTVENRIIEIEQYLKNVKIIEKNDTENKSVSIGDTVKITDEASGRELELKIVGTIEADVSKKMISNESPLGRSLINSSEGDIVTIKTKASTLRYRVDKIIR